MKIVLSKIRRGWFLFLTLFPITYTANKCGHKTELKGVPKNGTRRRTMPIEENGKPDHCLECIEKMETQCVLCGGPIPIGSRVVLYPVTDTYKVPNFAVPYYGNNLNAFIGCMRKGCAKESVQATGCWIPGDNGKGRVSLMPGALDILPSIKKSSETKTSSSNYSEKEKDKTVAIAD